MQEDTDDRWGISLYVHKRDILDKRQAQLIDRIKELTDNKDFLEEKFKEKFLQIEDEIEQHKLALEQHKLALLKAEVRSSLVKKTFFFSTKKTSKSHLHIVLFKNRCIK